MLWVIRRTLRLYVSSLLDIIEVFCSSDHAIENVTRAVALAKALMSCVLRRAGLGIKLGDSESIVIASHRSHVGQVAWT